MAEKAHWCSKEVAVKKAQKLYPNSDPLVDAFLKSTQNSPEFKAWQWRVGANVYGSLFNDNTVGLSAFSDSITLLFYSQPLKQIVDSLIEGSKQHIEQAALILLNSSGYSFNSSIPLASRLGV